MLKMKPRRRNESRAGFEQLSQLLGDSGGPSPLGVEFLGFSEHRSDAGFSFEDFHLGTLPSMIKFWVQQLRVGLVPHFETGENIKGLGAAAVAAVDEAVGVLVAMR